MVRMWLCPVKILCRTHLLGEHYEIHKITGSIIKGKKIDKYIENNCIELNKIFHRHLELVVEMKKRGYNHNSPIDLDNLTYQLETNENYMPYLERKIDRQSNLLLLLNRCKKCKKRYFNFLKNNPPFENVILNHTKNTKVI